MWFFFFLIFVVIGALCLSLLIHVFYLFIVLCIYLVVGEVCKLMISFSFVKWNNFIHIKRYFLTSTVWLPQ